MKITSFENLQVWKDSRDFFVSIYCLTSKEKFKRDCGLRDQIQRAALSVLNNIAEGFERNNNKEFLTYLKYSICSAGEIRSMLYIALDLNYLSKAEFKLYLTNTVNISTQLSNFMKYLRKCNIIK